MEALVLLESDPGRLLATFWQPMAGRGDKVTVISTSFVKRYPWKDNCMDGPLHDSLGELNCDSAFRFGERCRPLYFEVPELDFRVSSEVFAGT